MVSAQKPNKCANAKSVGECLRKYMPVGQTLDTQDLRFMRRAAQVANYDVTTEEEGCDSVAALVENTKAFATKALASANDMSSPIPYIFYEGDPMYKDTTIRAGTTWVSTTFGAYEKVRDTNGVDVHIIMTEDSLSLTSMFNAMMHELGHAANYNASEDDIEDVEKCIKRRPDEERKPKTSGGGGGLCWGCGGGSVIVDYIHGYCEYELRIYCDQNDEGDNQLPCRYEWTLIYCTIL